MDRAPEGLGSVNRRFSWQQHVPIWLGARCCLSASCQAVPSWADKIVDRTQMPARPHRSATLHRRGIPTSRLDSSPLDPDPPEQSSRPRAPSRRRCSGSWPKGFPRRCQGWRHSVRTPAAQVIFFARTSLAPTLGYSGRPLSIMGCIPARARDVAGAQPSLNSRPSPEGGSASGRQPVDDSVPLF